jgi:hypothetical protein
MRRSDRMVWTRCAAHTQDDGWRWQMDVRLVRGVALNKRSRQHGLRGTKKYCA